VTKVGPAGAPAPIEEAPSVGELPAIDRDALNRFWSEMGDDAGAILLDTIHVFLEQSNRHLQDLRQAVAEARSDEVNRLAHTLKGAGSFLGAAAFSEACRQLERAAGAAAAEALDEPALLLERVEAEYRRLAGELEQLADQVQQYGFHP